MPYSEKRLIDDWYEFNDSSVRPITPGTLSSKFGGSSHDGNAYMLVYRQKKMNFKEGEVAPAIPEYQKTDIVTKNVANDIAKDAYEILKN